MISNKLPNVLITGGNGLLASLWIECLQRNHNSPLALVKPIRNGYKKKHFVEDPLINNSLDKSAEIYLELVREHNIEAIVNTIGLANVEKCNVDKTQAYKSNVLYAKNISSISKTLDLPIIHISTDHLFGDTIKQYTEEDQVSLLNNYAHTKYLGELEVLNENPSSIVVRTNFYGFSSSYKSTFIESIVNNLNDEIQFNLFDDVYFNPLPVEYLIDISYGLLSKGFFGLYNISADNYMTKYKFGTLIAKELSISDRLLVGQSIDLRQDLLRRPKCMALSNAKVSTKLSIDVGSIELHIINLIKQQFNII